MAAAAFSVGGLASGLDTNTIIDKLMQLEAIPITLLQKRQAAFNTQISRLGDIKSKLADLTTAAKSLATSGAVATSVSSSQGGFDAVTGTGAVAGRHTIRVTSLASAAQARSQSFDSATAPVTGGTLAFNVQGTAYSVAISDGMGLSDVAFAIRQSGAPVSATVLNDGTHSYLSVLNNQTGFPATGTAPDALSMTETSTGILGQRLTAPATSLIVQAATNSAFTVDGLPISRQSNSVGDVIPGVTLNLKALTSSPETLVVGNNIDATKANISKFVDSYNSAMGMVQGQLVSTVGSDRSATLAGDPTIRSLQNSLQLLVTKQVSGAGAVRTLADIGVKTGRDGMLTLDSAVLGKALDKDANAVNDLFSKASTGLGTFTETTVKRYGDLLTGLLTTRTKGLQDSVAKLDTQITNLQMRVDAKRTELVNQFTQMERVISGLKASGTFLDQMDAKK